MYPVLHIREHKSFSEYIKNPWNVYYCLFVSYTWHNNKSGDNFEIFCCKTANKNVKEAFWRSDLVDKSVFIQRGICTPSYRSIYIDNPASCPSFHHPFCNCIENRTVPPSHDKNLFTWPASFPIYDYNHSFIEAPI